SAAAFHVKHVSLADAETSEQRIEHILRSAAAHEAIERGSRLPQPFGQQQRIGLPDGLAQGFTSTREQVTLAFIERALASPPQRARSTRASDRRSLFR